ncbi:putative helicase MOV-10/Armitage protein [Corchorus capsularis]|uniref:Putative helicase MOV-10/Armitage protein n=1 Tax=Corchorus capsularis TaxID=210143 RepID=A0A1R3I667_COCAP|nr:putative helicase MOV-10/Armitage protein [Corchorus capsularis]
MSFFLEFLKCILCCEDESIDIIQNNISLRNIFRRSRNYNTLSSSAIDESYATTRTQNHPRLYSNSSVTSSLLDSTRNDYSIRQSRPSDAPVQIRVVLNSDTSSNPAFIGSLFLKSVERVNQVPQNSRNSGTYTISPSPTSPKPPQSSTKLILPPPSPSPSSLKPGISSKPSKPGSSSTIPSSSSSKPPPSLKPTISPLPSDQPGKGNYKRVVPKDTVPIYMIPKDIEDLIKKDIVPQVLKKPLSPSTYQDYFAALLYAEDYYIEKWNNFELKDVPLELHPASIYQNLGRNKHFKIDDKTFVVFKVDSLSEKRPFLLSRDFVFAQPLGKKVEPFQGVIYRVVKSTTILVEFEDEFHSQHHPTRRYDISFSFNRVCLKRAHQAIAAASASLLKKFLFPDSVPQDLMPISASLDFHNYKLDQNAKSAVRRILNFRSPPPFLVKGPLCATWNDNSKTFQKQLSTTGLVIKEAVLQIYHRHPESKILVCAPINSTCDVLMRSLKMEIPVSDLFRANAAFRELEGLPIDILPSCLYERDAECFTCPSLQELRNFRVVLSTFVSSHRLHNAGITAGHFSYIFLVDSSSATEPETMVPLVNLTGEKTTVIVTGAPGNRSSFVRSDIARQKGLKISYFERLCELGPYKDGNPMFIAQLANSVS